MSKKHRSLGPITRHHLVPKQRLKDYYGNSFHMPKNIIRLWRFRHDAWHVLFGQKSLNEIIAYLQRKKAKAYGYQQEPWTVLFHKRTHLDAVKLLLRARQIIRKNYQFLEFDPSLQKKAKKIEKEQKNRAFSKIYLDKRFRKHPRRA